MSRALALVWLTGCLEVSGHPILLGPRDGGKDTGTNAGGPDAGDGGADAGSDGGLDAGPPPDGGCPDCPPRVIDIVTGTPTGEAADGRTFLFYDISPTGRYIGFAARAENIVPADANGFADVFLLDRVSGTTVLVSTTAAGEQANADSSFVSISHDGRFVAFGSVATNLVAGDDNGVRDVFVKDLVTGAIERVHVASDGTEANGQSFYASMSGDGRFVAFKSQATNLVAGDENGEWDVFLHDRETRVTVRASESPTGGSADGESDTLSLSGDGRYLAYASAATNLVAGDSNGRVDIFLYDRVDRVTRIISRGPSGEAANSGSALPFVNGDGRFVVYRSNASNLVPGDTNGDYDSFLFDRASGLTERAGLASEGAEIPTGSLFASVSDDGRFVAFASDGSALVPGDGNDAADVFVRDRESGIVERVLPAVGEPNDASQEPIVSALGGFVLFRSAATNWIAADENGEPDIFVAPIEPI
jgi:Tol biopolymer transport system component